MTTLRASLLASLSLATICAGLGATPAFAQDTATDADPGATIIVTGTRASNRTVADSPVPVDVISAETLNSNGSGELNRVLNKVVPSFNFPQPAVSDGSDAIRPATLRGLSPDQVLVLVNGKRRHVSALINVNGTVGRGAAAVDMNTIPSLAIKTIEVLRDGASSQYGSDAIAGVINVRLKDAPSGGRATASYGKYVTTIDNVPNVTGLVLSGGQPVLDASDPRYFQYTTDGERKARDGQTWAVASNVGLPIGPEGYLNLTAEYRSRDATNRQMADLRPNYIRPTSTTFDPREVNFNRLNFRIGDPKAEDYTIFLNGAAPISDGVELYVFESFNQRDSVSAANYRQQSANTNRDYSVLAPATAPTNANFVGLTPDGFLPLIASDSTDMAGTLGLRGDMGAWKWDLSGQYGQNQLDYRTENSLNVSFGPASQRNFNSGGLRYRQAVFNLDLSRELYMGMAKPATFSVGAEYRRESYRVAAGDYQSYARGPYNIAPFVTTSANCAAQGGTYDAALGRCTLLGRTAAFGAQGFPGIPANSASNNGRQSVAGYAEFDADPVQGLSTQLAGRFEHFTDFGNTLTGKFAARYEFVPGFAIRGAISNGFRAPSLHQQYFSAFSTNIVNSVPVDILTLPVTNPLAQLLGAKPLKPEKSMNYSAGFSANPLRGLTLTVDYYNIKITDRIVLTENLGAGGSNSTAVNNAVKAVLDANGYAGLGAARFFINGLDTRTTGVDAVMNWRLPLGEGVGRWNLTAAYNYTKNKIIARKAVLGALAQVPNLTLFGRQESLRFEDGQPKDKIVLSLDGDVGKFGLTARTTRYGEVTATNANPPVNDPNTLTGLGPDDYILQPKWITDLELRFNPTDRLHISLGADNVFDVYPTRAPYGLRPATSLGAAGVYPANAQYFPYSVFSPFGFNGRYLYGRVAVDF
jgi:iron complex outermembrane receptor protein